MNNSPWQSVRFKLSITMVLMTLSIIVIAILGNGIINKLNKGVDTFGNSYLPALSAVLNADRDLYQAKEAELAYLLGHTNADVKQDFEDNAQQALDRMNKFKAQLTDQPEVLSKLASFDATFTEWKSKADRVFQLVDAGKISEAMEVSDNQAKPAFDKLRDLYDIAGESLDNIAKTDREQLDSHVGTSLTTISVFIVTVILVSLGFTLVIPKVLVSNINELTNRIKEISKGDGDLTLRINSSRHDEIGLLAHTFDSFVNNLENLIRITRQQAEQLSHGAGSLEMNTAERMHKIENQNRSVDLIASAVNEFNTAIHQVANNSQQTANETANTVDISNSGKSAINNSVSQIEQLASSFQLAETSVSDLELESENIASVLDVIRGIADQTNLLALNAAIEAARAGDHGRGFAVVSDEVRSLASKTQDSTEEIQKMIERLQKGVKQAVSSIQAGSSQMSSSVESVRNTQNLLTSIENSANQVNDMAMQIATATEQQSQLTQEINTNLKSLGDTNNEVLHLSQETQSVASDFKTKADQLFDKVKRFKVS